MFFLVSGMFKPKGTDWVTIGPQPTIPVGPHFGYRGDTWTKPLKLGLSCASWSFTGYGVGPNWAPASKPSWTPRCVG